eukprot:587315-Prymnesium_polylepis.1
MVPAGSLRRGATRPLSARTLQPRGGLANVELSIRPSMPKLEVTGTTRLVWVNGSYNIRTW